VDPAQLLSRIKTLGGALTPAQRLSLAGAFATVVLVMGASTYWLGRTDYALLFADMDAEAASDVVTRLKAAKVEYQIDDGGRSIRVPAAKVDELRLEFASTGLPPTARSRASPTSSRRVSKDSGPRPW
jgi:flagellar M-ring protein FliF